MINIYLIENSHLIPNTFNSFKIHYILIQIARFVLEILVAFEVTCNYNFLISGQCFDRNAFSI
jgi:hypothetical protein